MEATTNLATSYASTGAVVVRGLLDAEMAGFLCSYTQLMASNGRMKGTANQVPGSLEMYGDPAFDTALGRLTPKLSRLLSLRLTPTYSFVRVYRRGQELARHRDRASCEHSVTIHLGASEPLPWPVCYTDRGGDDQAVELIVGDAVSYHGCELTHWRAICPVDWYIQAFLHYVDIDGPHASFRLDRRRQLGVPPNT